MNYRNASTDRLINSIIGLSSAEECYALLEDLCTIKEIQDMAQRLDTAVMLDRGESYKEISSKMNISGATISRVSRCLNYGSGGYKNAIAKMKESE